jgi:adenosylcobinamide kinase/adenosylcobinamide-phosphate guanylyltransferase
MSNPFLSPSQAELAPLVVVAGGARSGKSRFAVELAEARGERRGFIATAQAFDDEMRARIELHRRERGSRFETLESPRDLAEVARSCGDFDVVLLDCLTIYVSNALLNSGDVETLDTEALGCVEQTILTDVRGGIVELRRRVGCVVVVTSEVGMGVVPASKLGRVFRDVAGRANQWIANEATEVWTCLLGIPLRIKPTLQLGRNTADLGITP